MGRYESCKYFDTLYDATEKCFPNVNRENAQTILREVILAPDDYTVEFNDDTYDKHKIMDMLAHTLTMSCVEESPEQTYRDIINCAAEIMKHMNDGYITDEDYDERQNFIERIDRYEFTLFAAYSFLQTTHSDDETVMAEVALNIVRLREIRDLITNYTRDEKGITTDREEFERAKPIYKMLKSLQTLGYDYNFSPKERQSLDIDHEDDDDLNGYFKYENWLKRIMLLQLRKEIVVQTATESAAQYTPSRPSEEDLSDRIAMLRGTYNKRRFDKNRFIMLESSKESLNENDEKIG
ncbi:MAG: hypothetical protein IKR92_01675 [Alphaproteobacteria bacterium]|nr:hypothetical protein [Alphaproteobacteria bacterium]